MSRTFGKIKIQGDNEDEWWDAFNWQIDFFKETENMGGQGGMMYADTESSIRKYGSFKYKIRVTQAWGKIELINIDTGKCRQMIELPKHSGALKIYKIPKNIKGNVINYVCGKLEKLTIVFKPINTSNCIRRTHLRYEIKADLNKKIYALVYYIHRYNFLSGLFPPPYKIISPTDYFNYNYLSEQYDNVKKIFPFTHFTIVNQDSNYNVNRYKYELQKYLNFRIIDVIKYFENGKLGILTFL